MKKITNGSWTRPITEQNLTRQKSFLTNFRAKVTKYISGNDKPAEKKYSSKNLVVANKKAIEKNKETKFLFMHSKNAAEIKNQLLNFYIEIQTAKNDAA